MKWEMLISLRILNKVRNIDFKNDGGLNVEDNLILSSI